MNYSLGNMLSRGGALNPDGLALDLQFAADKTLTARRGPTPTFTRASTATFVGSNGLIQTAAINAPRFDHDPVTLASRGLLIEESRTNLMQFSEDFTNSYWSAFTTATALNVVNTSPSGASTSSRITANSGTSNERIRLRLTSISSGSTAYTYSCFIKAGTSDFGLVSLFFNKVGVGVVRVCQANIVFSTGVITKSGTSNADFTVRSTAFPDGWYRISISGTSNANTAIEDQVIGAQGLSFDGVGGSGTFTGTETIFAWGAQLELGSFPTSYIPTTTASVVRSADVCSITGSDFSGFWNQSEGTIFAAYSFVSGYTNVGRSVIVAQASNNSFNELVRIGSTTSGTSPTFDTTVAATLTRATALNNFDFSGINKTSAAYIVGNNAISHNGNAVVTSSPAAITSSCARLDIGRFQPSAAANLPHNGHIASMRYYRKRLSNAKLQSLTA
jgi:hypothetical protein